jgi:IS1 family transposase
VATGRIGEELVTDAVEQTAERTAHEPLSWCSDGWRGYPAVIVRQYRHPVHTGKRGRPRLALPDAVQLTQTIKHRTEQGRIVSIETRAVLGTRISPAGTVHVERFNGTLRDRLNALTRKTHAFAKCDATWDALLWLQCFEHNWLRSHPALRLPSEVFGQRYQRRSPAMALGLADHVWSWPELLTTRCPVTPG